MTHVRIFTRVKAFFLFISSGLTSQLEAQHIVWQQRETGWSSYFYLKPRSELSTEGETAEEWNLDSAREHELGNVNHLDSGDINCAWSSGLWALHELLAYWQRACVWMCWDLEAERGRPCVIRRESRRKTEHAGVHFVCYDCVYIGLIYYCSCMEAQSNGQFPTTSCRNTQIN